MDKSIKTVLISTASLPHKGVASWTTRINYLLEKENNIDYVIGPNSTIKIEKPKQIFISQLNLVDKVKRKYNRLNRFNNYMRGLKQVIELEKKIILQVKDNFGLLKAIVNYVDKHKLRKQIYIQYHHHTFQFNKLEEGLLFRIDEVVFLTKSSYHYNKEHLNAIPCLVSINNNGIDSNLFYPLSPKQKITLKEQLNLNTKKLTFIWCSQNRRKKGLEVILNAWNELYANFEQDIELIVVGIPNKIDIRGVKSIGLLDNKELATYYKSADFYLFTTLCQEGFGLSLIEALKSGCYCISSDYGAVSEILKYGKYGKLIENPNIVSNWVEVITASIKEFNNNNNVNPYLAKIPDNIYDINDWYIRYNTIIDNAKKAFSNRYYL